MRISSPSTFLFALVLLGTTLLAGSMFFIRDVIGTVGHLSFTDFSPDRTHLAANSFRGFEIIDRRKGITATLHTEGKRAAFSPDLQFLALYSQHKDRVSIWDLHVNPPAKIKELPVSANAGLVWLPDSQHLIMVDSQLSSWNRANDSIASVPLDKPENFNYRPVRFVPGKDNALYLLNPPHYENMSANVEIRDAASLMLRQSIPLPPTDDWFPELSPDGRFVLLEERGEHYPNPLTLSLFNIEQQKITARIEVPGGAAGSTFLFTDDSQLLAIPGWHVVTIWSTKTGERKYRFASQDIEEQDGYSEWAWLPDNSGLLAANSSSVCTYLLKEEGKSSSCTNIEGIVPTYQWLCLAVLSGISVVLLYSTRKPVALSSSAILPLSLIISILAGGLALFQFLERIYGLWFPLVLDAIHFEYAVTYRSSLEGGLTEATILLPITVCIIFRLVKSYANLSPETWKVWRALSILTLAVAGFKFFWVIAQGG